MMSILLASAGNPEPGFTVRLMTELQLLLDAKKILDEAIRVSNRSSASLEDVREVLDQWLT